MNVLQTERLTLRHLSLDDAAFILALLNEPSWLRFIGDKDVHSLDDARAYITKGPLDMYQRLGFGLYLAERREDGRPIGLCGLIKRETLKDVDIGFAFPPEFWGKGYAYEAAAAVVEHGRSTFGLKRLVAITSLDNRSSIRLLEKLGFGFEGMIKLSEDGEELRLFGRAL
ncbi:MAG TPA: GNAT family N-acetyltransferase [Myxococcaceae bacterium]|jgi:RimJ/RimL family protein N-acetyltransferase|nr:GNAT family N-acetyltransferase [Myxococcaceae bacterium]